MAYIPPHYAPRDDWRTLLRNGGGPGNSVNNWIVDMVLYFKFTEDDGLSPLEAWNKLRMSYDHASKAFSGQPPTPTNNAGLIPPAIAQLVFARALAKSPDFTHLPTLRLEHSIKVDRDATERSFTAPRYRPRADWRERLESMDPEDGSWQGDLVKYWTLRTQEKSEEDAWSAVAMSPSNARMALIEDETSPDSGLMPSLPDGVETVARRVLARSAAKDVDADDIYRGLGLQPA